MSDNGKKVLYLLAFKTEMMDLPKTLEVVCGLTANDAVKAIAECKHLGYIEETKQPS